jgi:hypothetical protein
MIDQQMCNINLYVPHVIACMSFAVSFFALWYTIDKDKKKAIFQFYIGSKVPINDLRNSENYPSYICGNFVNVGRRQICISHVGGEMKESFFEMLVRMFTKRGVKYRFLFPNIEINNAFKDKDGSFKVIEEGHKVSFDFIALPATNLSKADFDKQVKQIKRFKSIYAEDVDGTKYYLSKSGLKKYIRDNIDALKKVFNSSQ